MPAFYLPTGALIRGREKLPLPLLYATIPQRLDENYVAHNYDNIDLGYASAKLSFDCPNTTLGLQLICYARDLLPMFRGFTETTCFRG